MWAVQVRKCSKAARGLIRFAIYALDRLPQSRLGPVERLCSGSAALQVYNEQWPVAIVSSSVRVS